MLMDQLINLTFLPSMSGLHITPLMSFGLLLVLGAMGGYMAHRLPWVPSITGFMLVGFIFGPKVLDVLSYDVLKNSRVMVDIALGLILYRLGLSLDIRSIFMSSQLFVIAFIESLLTFAVTAFVVHEFGIGWKVSCLIGAIAVSSSPAVLLHVAHEVHAKGPVTESAKSLVALNNVFSFIIFSAILPIMYADVGADWQTMVLQPTYRLLGSMLVGIALAYILFKLAKLTETATQYRLALVIGVVMIELGATGVLKLSPLFAPLVLGIVIRTLEEDDLLSRLDFGPAFELFFIVLFVYAGAKLDISVIMDYWELILALALARTVAKMIGVTGTAFFFKVPFSRSVSAGMLLIPMAGLAIGLVQTTNSLFPSVAATVSALVLGAVAIFETLGPPIAAYAFRIAGEAGKDTADHPDDTDGDGELSIQEQANAAAKADIEGYRAKYSYGYGVVPFGGGSLSGGGKPVTAAGAPQSAGVTAPHGSQAAEGTGAAEGSPEPANGAADMGSTGSAGVPVTEAATGSETAAGQPTAVADKGTNNETNNGMSNDIKGGAAESAPEKASAGDEKPEKNRRKRQKEEKVKPPRKTSPNLTTGLEKGDDKKEADRKDREGNTGKNGDDASSV